MAHFRGRFRRRFSFFKRFRNFGKMFRRRFKMRRFKRRFSFFRKARTHFMTARRRSYFRRPMSLRGGYRL